MLELGRALIVQGYFTDAAAVFEQGASAERAPSWRPSRCSTSRSSARFGGLDGLRRAAAAGRVARSAPGSRSRARRPRARGADHAEAALAGPPTPTVVRRRADRADGRRAARAGRRDLDRRRRRRPRDAASSRRCGSRSRCGRMVRMRQGRVAEAEADLRELIAWVGELELPYGELPDGAAVGDRAARRRADRARRARRGAALGDAHRPGARLAGGLRLHVPARQPGAAAARAGPRARGARTSRASARAASARGASATPASCAWGSTLAAAAARHRPHRGGARRLRPADRPRRARFGVAREHGHGAARARRASPATPDTLRARGRRAARPRPPGSSYARALADARRPRVAARRRSSSPSAAARPRSPPAPATRSSTPARSRAARG